MSLRRGLISVSRGRAAPFRRASGRNPTGGDRPPSNTPKTQDLKVKPVRGDRPPSAVPNSKVAGPAGNSGGGEKVSRASSSGAGASRASSANDDGGASSEAGMSAGNLVACTLFVASCAFVGLTAQDPDRTRDALGKVGAKESMEPFVEAIAKVATLGSGSKQASAGATADSGGGGQGEAAAEEKKDASEQEERGRDDKREVASPTPAAESGTTESAATQEGESEQGSVALDSRKADAAPDASSVPASVPSTKAEKSVSAYNGAAPSSSLQSMLQRDLVGDLDDLSLEELRTRLRQMIFIFRERNKWEAQKSLEVLREAEFMVAQRYSELLADQKFELMARAEAELARAAQEEQEETRRQLHEIERAHAAEDMAVIGAEKDRLREYFEATTKEKIANLKIEIAGKSEDVFAEMNAVEEAQTTRRSEKVAAMIKEAEKYEEAWAHVKTRSEDGLEKHRTIAQALLGTLPEQFEFGAGAADVDAKGGGAGDAGKRPSSLPLTEAAPSLDELRIGFVGKVYPAALEHCLVPDSPIFSGALGTFLGAALARLMAKSDPTARSPQTPSAPLSVDPMTHHVERARASVAAGDLSAAVGELKQLRGRPRVSVNSWIIDAEKRLRCDQAMEELFK